MSVRGVNEAALQKKKLFKENDALREFLMLLRVVNAESCSQSFAEGYQRIGTHFVVGGVLKSVMPACERDNPCPESFTGSL